MSDRWIYRVQDATGRGPWRPGFSSSWISRDDSAPNLPPTILEEFPNCGELVAQAHRERMHTGCGARGVLGLSRWFLDDEAERLKGHGYFLVRCHAVKVLAESRHQVLFASRNPLWTLPRVKWPDMCAIGEAA